MITSAWCAVVCALATAGGAGAQPDQRAGRERPVATPDAAAGIEAWTEARTKPRPDAETDDDLGVEPAEALVEVRFATGSARLSAE